MIGSSQLSVLGETEAQRGSRTVGQHKALVGTQAEAATQHQEVFRKEKAPLSWVTTLVGPQFLHL